MAFPEKHVLLVEDERPIRVLVGSILRQKGYVTVEAGNGLEALDALRDDPSFDLIITDLHMPELDGIGFLRELSAHYPDIPIIVISAYTSAEWAQVAVDNAVVALPKPFSHAQLVSAVDRMVH